MTWHIARVSGSDSLEVRAAKKLKSDELLLTAMAATALRLELDRLLWRGDSVPVKQLVEDFASYNYLPRLRDSSVLINAIREGAGLLMWQNESFAFAEKSDEATGRYLGLRGGQHVP
jgi:hypothetical protein